MERIFNNNLLGLVPKYIENIGDCTEIIIEGREAFIIERTISTVLNRVLRHYMIDLREIKNIYSKYINYKNLIPIAFDRENIFIPFKARRSLSTNDKAFGYFNLKYYDRIYIGKSSIDIVMKDGQRLRTISRPDSFTKHLKNGYIVSACYERREMYQSNKEEYRPTNKSDLELLLKAMGKIIEKI